MPREIKTTVYNLSELTGDKARENALNCLRAVALSHDWWEFIYEDAKNVGCKIRSFDLRNIDFCFQWDAPKIALAICEQHGKTCDTHKAAVEFLADDLGDEDEEYNEEVEKFRLKLADCYLKMLQDEVEYLESDGYLNELAEMNDYTFTVDGALTRNQIITHQFNVLTK